MKLKWYRVGAPLPPWEKNAVAVALLLMPVVCWSPLVYPVLEAENIRVTFNGGLTGSATVIANDHSSGLALLRTELPSGITAMNHGESRKKGISEAAVVLSYGGSENALQA